MNDLRQLPSDLTPLNFKAWSVHALGVCGCADTGSIYEEVQAFLQWCNDWLNERSQETYETLYPRVGLYYLMAGILDTLDLIDHGTSIRWPFLTDDGKRLLSFLQASDEEVIENASGEAYDGCYYGGSEG